jgi:hypothetical protein
VLFVGDLNRRLIRIEIDPRCEKPHEREFAFNPLAYVRERRLEFVHDALTVLRGAIRQDVRLNGDYGSFEDWNRLLRKAVVWVGSNGWLEVDDPLLSVSAGFEQDPEVQKLSALMLAWKSAFGKHGATVPEAIRKAEEKNNDTKQPRHPELYDVLDEVAGERGKLNSRRLGAWIKRRVKRIVDGCYFTDSGTRQNYKVWVVHEASSREFREFRESANNPCIENLDSKKLYNGFPENSPNSQNSHDGNGADTDLVTCSPCANFQPNQNNPGFQGHCIGNPPDGERLKFPHLKHDCPEFRQRAEA